MKKKFEVTIYYSSFYTCKVDAENQDEAIRRARNLTINKNEIISNFENWKEADNAREIEYEEVKS